MFNKSIEQDIICEERYFEPFDRFSNDQSAEAFDGAFGQAHAEALPKSLGKRFD